MQWGRRVSRADTRKKKRKRERPRRCGQPGARAAGHAWDREPPPSASHRKGSRGCLADASRFCLLGLEGPVGRRLLITAQLVGHADTAR